MKAFMAFLLVVGVLGGFYYAYQFVIKKSFQAPAKPATYQTKSVWDNQNERTSDLQQRQRDLMQQRQDRMRATQRR